MNVTADLMGLKMPFAALKIKIMPSSPKADLKNIELKAKEAIESFDAQLHSVEIQSIAFGLKSLVLTIAWPEEKDLEMIENKLNEIKNVNSIEIVDFRRAIG